MKVMIQQVLTLEFWEQLRAKASSQEYTSFVQVMSPFTDWEFEAYTRFKFGDVPVFPETLEMNATTRAEIAFIQMGAAFERIASALLTDYNPLENYFTDRTMSTESGSDSTKTGDIETTPTGTVTVTDSGKMIRDYDGSDTIGQGTTYDNASTDETASDEFVNISKTINNTKVTEESDPEDPKKRETSYNDYKVTQSFKDLNTNTTGEESVTENRSGSSGIFSKQDLTQREIDLRLRNRVLPILVRMAVDVFATGVYSDDD